MAVAIKSILNIITKRLKLSNVFIVVCTNSFSLYKCLVKLEPIKEKRFIIDIMALK
jgi:hypothetical protein